MPELTTRRIELDPQIDRIKKWLESVVNNPEMRKKLLILGTLELADRARVYPEKGLWNYEPGTNGYSWYERGKGTRWRRKGGSRGGKPYFSGYGGTNTSEKLQNNWKTEIDPTAYSASVYTNVSYAPYLFDPFQRVSWAEAHGWKDIDEIANDYAPRFEKLTLEYIDDELEKPIK